MTIGTLDRLPALDGVRAIAILLVLAGHFIGFGGLAGAGVALFFVLSGFLITRLLLADVDRNGRVRFGRFDWRRVCRIVPAYLAWVGITWLILGDATQHADRTALTGLLTYTYNYITPAAYGFNSIIHPAWSLAVEEQFYLLWPLLLTLLGSQRAYRLLPILFGAGLAWRCIAVFALGVPQTYLDWAFEANAGTLALGCWLAIHQMHGGRLWWLRLAKPRWLAIWIGILVCSIGLEFQALGKAAIWAMPLTALVMFLLTSSALQQGPHPLLSHRLLRWIAAISYPLYLWHLWGLAIGERMSVPHVLQITIAVVASLGLASASYYLLERPILRWRDRGWSASTISQPTTS
jgi:peptidoglycan/LPS O-acetylase OafA/YrhL